MQMEGRKGMAMPVEQRDGAREAQPYSWLAALPASAFCVPEVVVEIVRRTKSCLCGTVVLGTARKPCSKPCTVRTPD